jgi:hypothetical protein
MVKPWKNLAMAKWPLGTLRGKVRRFLQPVLAWNQPASLSGDRFGFGYERILDDMKGYECSTCKKYYE